MTHFEYMEMQGQLTIFDLEDQYEQMQFKLSTHVKTVDKKKKPLQGPRIVGYIVRR